MDTRRGGLADGFVGREGTARILTAEVCTTHGLEFAADGFDDCRETTLPGAAFSARHYNRRCSDLSQTPDEDEKKLTAEEMRGRRRLRREHSLTHAPAEALPLPS